MSNEDKKLLSVIGITAIITAIVLIIVDIAVGQETINPFDLSTKPNPNPPTAQEIDQTPPAATPTLQTPKRIKYRVPRSLKTNGPTWYFSNNVQGRRLANHILSTHRPTLMKWYGSKMTYPEISSDIYTFNNRELVALHSRLHNWEVQQKRMSNLRGG